jgi:hypothetical protein
MSYDVYVCCHVCGEDLMGGYTNMTSNVAGVWDAAGAPIRDWDGKQGVDVLPRLAGAIRHLRQLLPYEREELEELVRGGGSWGTVDSALEFLERIRDAICRNPLAKISVSR